MVGLTGSALCRSDGTRNGAFPAWPVGGLARWRFPGTKSPVRRSVYGAADVWKHVRRNVYAFRDQAEIYDGWDLPGESQRVLRKSKGWSILKKRK